MSWPKSFTFPCEGMSLPLARSMSVDFPQPFDPIMLVNVPGNPPEKFSKTGEGTICFPFSSRSPSTGGYEKETFSKSIKFMRLGYCNFEENAM